MNDRIGAPQSLSRAALAPRQLIAAILEEPELVAAVQALAPQTLGRLVQHVGLEDCGELISLATTAQLERLFDEDLWHNAAPGAEERFDVARFLVWLEVMLEAGDEYVARKLTELPDDLVLLALQQLALVINVDDLAISLLTGAEDVDFTEKALDGCLSLELAEFQIIARQHDGWDTLVTVLTALDRDHHHVLHRWLERCAASSAEYVDDNGGLYNVLTAAEMMESDAAAEREDRRAHEGFVGPSAAASFLALARTTPLADIIAASKPDPITAGYFRQLRPTPPVDDDPRAARLLALLADAEVADARPSLPQLEAPDAVGQAFRHAMSRQRQTDPALYGQRMQELAYLANVLVAGAGRAARRLRPFEAAEAAVTFCNVGLEHLALTTGGDPADLLAQHAAKLFQIGWHLVARDGPAAIAAVIEAANGSRTTSSGAGR